MADFCMQCAKDLGFPESDLAGLVTQEQYENEKLVAVCICEGCGPTIVDYTGRCVNKECLMSHGDCNG